MNRTKDLWFASFLLLKGYVVQRYNVISTHKGEFFFDIEEEEWTNLKLQFSNSEVSKVKYYQEKLKDLIY